jgi:hypothetical protein
VTGITVNPTIQWLLGDDNPAVKYRTQTEILGENADRSDTVKWVYSKLPADFHDTKGLWYTYYVTALAECGLCAEDIASSHIKRAFDLARDEFDGGCASFMLLRALVKIGYKDEIDCVMKTLDSHLLPDGAFVCLRIKNKLKYTPKSCYKAAVQALLCAAECRKSGVDFPNGDKLLDYFLGRDIFYRRDESKALIMDGRPGWRIIDTLNPFEPMRVGIHHIVEAFCALGYGSDDRLTAAWNLLREKCDTDGKYLLDQTLTKSYLPKERPGKPSKWVTFYALLAQKERERNA